MSEHRRSIERRLMAAGGDPRRGRELADELADELVTSTTKGSFVGEQEYVLAALSEVITRAPSSAAAGIAADALAIAGNRLGRQRSPGIDQALLSGIEGIVSAHGSTADAAPLVNALAELSATRPIPAAIPVMTRILDLAHGESTPSLMTLDGALTVLRVGAGPTWRERLESRWGGVPANEYVEEAIRFAARGRS